MVFNSLAFIIFLIIVLSLYYFVPNKHKWILLLLASYYFYMYWKVEFILLILFSSFVNYYFANIIYNNKSEKTKKNLLKICIIINLTLLFIFKYLVFVSESFRWLYTLLGLNYPIKDFNIILPLGISFYTFQATSYVIDIYRGRYKPEKNFFKMSLYITFFPQLVAGPIERADRLLSQLFSNRKFNVENISTGAKIMLIGYFKKVVIADRVAILVNTVYNQPLEYTGISFIIATVFFAFQIYCDFSGYSDIAIGCAKLFGIDLMQNFNSPYLSKNMKEFWARWHISLSSWFKDYLYIPLGGNRCSLIRNYFNIFITFTVSGIWHGANWTFVLWGALHGFYQIIGNLKNIFFKTKYISKFEKVKVINFILSLFKIGVVFSLVCFAWIFFRANNIYEGIYIAKNLFNDINKIFDLQYMYNLVNSLGINMFELIFVTICIIILLIIELFEKNEKINKVLDKTNFLIRFSFYYILVLIILALGVYENVGEFIYFQF